MELLEFLKKTPTAFHAAAELEKILNAEGAVRLSEKKNWSIEPGKTYYTVRNESALIAFRVPENAFDEEKKGFRVFAAHGDSPTFKIKENPESVVENRYVKLNVERYGGMIMSSWFDRPLSVAGRVIVQNGSALESKLVNIDRDLLMIPNVAIHMNRDVNSGYDYNAQTDLCPLYGGIEAKGTFMKQVAEAAGVSEEDILGHDLFLYNRMEGTVWGAEKEFVSAAKIDDCECALGGLLGFLKGRKEEHITVYAMFDNEEVGSQTRQGAGSTFLADVLTRISENLGDTASVYQMRLADSYMISADNGHAVHPNHPEKTDPTNRPVLNGGILLKFSANQRYTTDGLSAAMFKSICKEADVPFQIFFNRSDMLGGSTLGNISTSQVPFNTADIGLTQLAMHSSYETAGVKDFDYLVRFAEKLFA